jgi:hypothetical protein
MTVSSLSSSPGMHPWRWTGYCYVGMLCLRSEDAFVITCVANLMEVKVFYVQQDLRYEISSYWCFNV